MHTPSNMPQHPRSQVRNPFWIRVLDFGIIEPFKHPAGVDSSKGVKALPLFETLP
jgi:hypothetical protein